MKVKELTLIVFGIFLMLGSSYYLFWYDLSDDTDLNKKSLAILSEKNNEVRKKPNGKLSWVTVGQDAPFYEGDMVFTSNGAEAVLKLEDKTEINLSELSLLKISNNDNEGLNLDLMEGFVVTEMSKNSMLNSIKTGDQRISLLGADLAKLQFDLKADEKTITVMDGSIGIEKNGKKIEVGKDQLVGVNKNGEISVRKLDFSLKSPTSNKIIYALKNDGIQFEWQKLNPEVSDEVLFEISRDPEFKEIIKGVKLKDTRYSFMIGDLQGVFYWRIKNSDHHFYHKQKFIIKPLIYPTVFFPRSDKPIFSLTETTKLTLEWELFDGITYDFVINKFVNGKSIEIAKHKTKKNMFKFDEMTLGEYSLKIRSLFGEKSSDWSPEMKFTLAQEKMAEAAILVEPQNDKKIIYSASDIPFLWRGTESANYTFQISTDEKFKTLILSQELVALQFNMNSLTQGKYFWRVVSTRKPELTSPVFSFELDWVTPDIISPENNLKKVFLPEKNESITFEWKDIYPSSIPEKNKVYLLEISESEDFSNVQSFEIKGTTYLYPLTKSQNVYWRVRALNSSHPSEMRTIEIKEAPPLKAPTLKDTIKLKIKKEAGIQFGQDLWATNSNISYGKNASGYYIDLSWEQIEFAKSYYVEIYLDSKLSQLVRSQKIETPKLRWFKPEAGTYFWRISFEDEHGRKSDFSNLSKLIIEESKLKKARAKVKLQKPLFAETFTGYKEKEVEFKWEPIPQATLYKLKIKNVTEGKESSSTKTTNNGELKTVLAEAPYEWTVSAYDAKKNLVGRSEKRSFIIESSKIVPPKNPFQKDYAFISTGGGAIEMVSSLVDEEETAYNIDSTQASLLLQVGYNFNYYIFLEGFFEGKTTKSDNLSGTEMGALAYYNMMMSEKFKMFLGGGVRKTNLNFLDKDSALDSELILDFSSFISRIALIWSQNYYIDHYFLGEAGAGFTTVKAFNFSAYYQFRYMPANSLKWHNLFYHAGVRLERSDYTFENSSLITTNNSFLFGVGFNFDESIWK
jgi:hypothetical protein